MLRRRFQARKPKDYKWTHSIALGTAADDTITDGLMLQGSDCVPQASLAKGHFNLQRLILDLAVGIANPTLEDSTAATWSYAWWALMLLDEDDTTVYNPEDSTTLIEETVLMHGMTERIGWSTVQDAIAPLISQSAAFMAQANVRRDVRSNRRMTSDQVLRLFLTMEDNTSWARGSDNDNYIVTMSLRTLIKLP